MALLENDISSLKKLTEEYFNVKDFDVFLCIVTGRTRESINKGILKTKFTAREVYFILNVCINNEFYF